MIFLCLKYISKIDVFFCDVFKTSPMRLKKDVFYATSLRGLNYISKKFLFSDVSVTSQRYRLQVFLIFQN